MFAREFFPRSIFLHNFKYTEIYKLNLGKYFSTNVKKKFSIVRTLIFLSANNSFLVHRYIRITSETQHIRPV